MQLQYVKTSAFLWVSTKSVSKKSYINIDLQHKNGHAEGIQ